MLLNYFTHSLRLMARSPFFTIVNLTGLAIGFASFYALWEYSLLELKSDQYHKDSERMARIATHWNWTDPGKPSGHLIFGWSPSSMLPAVSDEFPEVESTLRLRHQRVFSDVVISFEDETGRRLAFKEDKVAHSDSNLFNFFAIPLVYGHPDQVLREANDVVLSRSSAIKYFGARDPTGELMKLNDTTTLKVSGVFEDLPHYTHLDFQLVISNAGLINQWSREPVAEPVISYVKLNHKNFKSFEEKLNRKATQYWATNLRHHTNVKVEIFVQPLAEIPFSPGITMDYFHPKSRTFLFTLAFIALSVLVMAWVNYINLSVTRTSRRFKEIATRKVSGAGPSNLIGQFVIEAIVINVAALALAITMIQIVRSPASILFNIEIENFSSLSFQSFSILASIILAGVLLSGLYPAIISITYQPRVLFSLKNLTYRKRLVPSLLTVSQLAVAIIFITLGLTVSFQIRHILNMDTGIHHDQTIIVEAPIVKPDHYETLLSSFEKELSMVSGVSSVTSSSFLVNTINAGFDVKRFGSDHHFGTDHNSVDEDFIAFYGLKILAGRSFIRDDNPDGVIISRHAATRLGYDSPEKAVGAKIQVDVGQSGNWKDAAVLGVFQNFRNQSFLNVGESSTESNTEGRGVVLMYKNQQFDQERFVHDKISVRISAKNVEETVGLIQRKYQELFPETLFSWYFLDQKINEVYNSEKIARNQIVLFTALALIIASLGLLGTISNKVVEKTKEIGIRKVLGARVHQIAGLLLKLTAKHVIVATIVGLPVAYYLTQLYLEKYSERITLACWHFAAPIMVLAVVMLSTISPMLWKAGRNNPVDSLKCE